MDKATARHDDLEGSNGVQTEEAPEAVTIIKYPDQRLSQKSVKVKDISEAHQIIGKLINAIENTQWGTAVGMAAPQIGINKRVIIALGEAFINPVKIWTPKSGTNYYLEGCYSLEDERYDYKVERPYAITIQYVDINGEDKVKRFNGQKAQVIQHELDHLEGVLCHDPQGVQGEIQVKL